MNADLDPQPPDAAPDDFERRVSRQEWRPVPPAWRGEILASRGTPPTWRTLLRELLWPAPWAWGAVAAAWMLVAGLFTAAEWTAETGASLARRETQPGGDPLRDWQHQQALISALLEESSPPERQPAALPRPRSGLPGPRFGRHQFSTSLPTPV